MQRVLLVGLVALSAGVLASPAIAADRTILGKKVIVRNPDGTEPRRVTIVLAKERSTDVPAIVGDPTMAGATLRITIAGTDSSDEFYSLNSGNWTATSKGFVFRGGGQEPDPVQRVTLKRSPGGVALMKLVLRGSVGSRDLDIVPPNPGTIASVMLSINDGGDRYCASYGGPAGGTIASDTAALFRIVNATTEPPCPTNPPRLCCEFATVQQCAWAADAEECVDFGGNPGDGDSVCDSATGLCGPPPGDGGYCCQGPTTVFGTTCGSGPGVAPVCTGLGGTLFPAAACTSAGICASPSGAFVDPVAEL